MPNTVATSNISLLPDRALDVDEVAEFLNVCHATVRREVKRGRLRAYKVGQIWRFKPEDVLAYRSGEDPSVVAERTAWDNYIRKVVAAAPPLTAVQIAALTVLFDRSSDDGERA